MTLATLVQEVFVNEVSSRRIERLAHALSIENSSASQASEINQGLSGGGPPDTALGPDDRPRGLELGEEGGLGGRAEVDEDELTKEYGDRFAGAIRCLEDGLEDSFQFTASRKSIPKRSRRRTCRNNWCGRSGT